MPRADERAPEARTPPTESIYSIAARARPPRRIEARSPPRIPSRGSRHADSVSEMLYRPAGGTHSSRSIFERAPWASVGARHGATPSGRAAITRDARRPGEIGSTHQRHTRMRDEWHSTESLRVLSTSSLSSVAGSRSRRSLTVAAAPGTPRRRRAAGRPTTPRTTACGDCPHLTPRSCLHQASCLRLFDSCPLELGRTHVPRRAARDSHTRSHRGPARPPCDASSRGQSTRF